MKKLLLSLVTLFSALCINAADTTVSIDFSAQSYANATAVKSATFDSNVSAAFDKGGNSNAPKYYTSGTAVRMYGGNSMTISTTSGVIKSITLTYGASDGTNAITTDNGTFDGNAWTGSEKSVTFTIGGTTGHRRIKAVEVTYGEAGSANVAVESVALTDEAGNALTQYTTLTVTEKMTVKAVVTPANATNKKVTWEVMQGSEVISFENGVVTALAPGQAALVATTEDGEFQAATTFFVSDVQDGTIADFIAAEGKTCYLTGVVNNITNTKYGNFTLTDNTGSIYVYGCLNADGEEQKFAELGITEGDEIKVLASEYKYYNNETPEAVNVVFVEKLAAPTTFDIAFDGAYATITPSKEDVTYAVAAYNDDVLGIISNSGMTYESNEDIFDIYINDFFLVDVNAIQTGVGTFDLLDFMEYLGAESLEGNYTIIVAECHKEGNSDVVRDGKVFAKEVTATATGLSAINAVKNNGNIYTISGQKVAAARKGIYVINGKKVVKK